MHRHSFVHGGLTFSYLDAEGEGAVVIALHGHWMGGSDFEGLAEALAPAFRLVALDQRGFGETDHTRRHSRAAYVSDVIALLDHIGVTDPVAVIGHSFGAAVAWLVAAAHPERMSGLVVIDMDVVRDDADDFVLDWACVYSRREDLEAKLGERLSPYLQKSIHRVEGGWSLTWDPDEFLLSERVMNGDMWSDWLASTCPALVIHGADSPLVDEGVMRDMAQRRPNTRYRALAGGHSVHVDNADATAGAVREFLMTIGA